MTGRNDTHDPRHRCHLGDLCRRHRRGHRAVIARSFRWPEAIWAGAGAALLILCGLMPVPAALGAVARGLDVYLFLIGMMLLSETARREGLFDWIAATAAIHARGSPTRLFALVYGTGIVTTTFLSNDATAVVLTPPVYAAARKAKADPLPLLFACALIANAASFVLPISNPANLVLYGGRMPPLGQWFGSFAWASVTAIGVTFLVLRWSQRARLTGRCVSDITRTALTRGGMAAFAGIVATAALLLIASARDLELGLPTAIAGIGTMLAVSAMARTSPVALLRDVAWSVLPLVAGLFVLVEALDRTGVIAVVAQAQPPRLVVDALLIGVDLASNLSITGSLERQALKATHPIP